MTDIQDLLKNIDIIPFEVNHNHLVHITHINDPHDFYVRDHIYLELVQKIENLNSRPPVPSVKMDEIVLFDMETDTDSTKYARGQVVNIEDTGHSVICTLFAMDYGFITKKSLGALYKCDDLMLVIPPLAYKCQLAEFVKREETWALAIDAFKTYVKGFEHTKMVIQDLVADKLVVKLGIRENDDLATMLASTDFTTLEYVHNEGNRMQSVAAALEINQPAFILKELKTNFKMLIRVLSGLSIHDFYAAEVNDYRQYMKNRKHFAQHVKKQPKYEEGSLRIGDVICMKDFLNMYERAIVQEVLDSTRALVYLVDKGKEETVHHMNMRKMPPQYLNNPVVVFRCSVPVEEEGNKGCVLLHPGKEFYITIKELGHGINTQNIIEICNK